MPKIELREIIGEIKSVALNYVHFEPGALFKLMADKTFCKAANNHLHFCMINRDKKLHCMSIVVSDHTYSLLQNMFQCSQSIISVWTWWCATW